MTFEWPITRSFPIAAPPAGAAFARAAVEDESPDLVEQAICFTPGTLLATPQGARAVETLRPGDLVVTRDHGLQPLRWIGQREIAGTGNLAPVTFAPGSLIGLEGALSVSPQHRILMRSPQAELYFGDREVLVAATHLVGCAGVVQRAQPKVTYLHILFDQHEIIYAEGAATESFHPGDSAISALTAPTREELFSMFPALRSSPPSGGRTARRCLRRHEALMLTPTRTALTRQDNQLR